jgi:aspartokinase/homoserine dehydrogenase 1
MHLEKFVQFMTHHALPDAIFVDCTASDAITKWYPTILESAIAIVTPNKRANSGDLQQYHTIRNTAKKAQTFFLYETNVCAGLPVLETVADLLTTGDEIIKIEGVLSGTLSYIFNNFVSDKRFSEVVKEAREQGYTEPDPRDDLNGLDVGRKLLILAREAGLELEMSDIEIENLVPASARNAVSVDDFLTKLAAQDTHFEKLKAEAAKEQKRLRYIGQIDFKKHLFFCKLEMVAVDHPFYSLSGSDNIVSITTKRYNKTPMVIKGPGAGAEVTADGVFTDIIQVGKYYAYRK